MPATVASVLHFQTRARRKRQPLAGNYFLTQIVPDDENYVCLLSEPSQLMLSERLSSGQPAGIGIKYFQNTKYISKMCLNTGINSFLEIVLNYQVH